MTHRFLFSFINAGIGANGVEIPIYPSMLTPIQGPNDGNLAAYPNNIHASIQYGEEGAEKQIIDRHFQHNGYSNYQHMEEENDKKVGFSDVIHSVGALFHVIEAFPKLSQSFNQKQDHFISLDEMKIRKPSPVSSSSFSFPEDVDQEDYESSNQEAQDQPLPTASGPLDMDETTTFEASRKRF